MKPHDIYFQCILSITLKGSEQQNVSVLATALAAGSLYASANYGNICHIFLVNRVFSCYGGCFCGLLIGGEADLAALASGAQYWFCPVYQAHCLII